MAARSPLPLRHAAALGALHGPTELFPVSSSGHTTLIPWLARWPYPQLDADLRKAFEVALHAGTAAALLVALRRGRAGAPQIDLRGGALAALGCAPAALAGYLFEQPVERRLGTPPTVAAGLVMGSLAMLWADRAPATRHRGDAGVGDALWLGIAQASALMPGVSRSGATLAAARRRRFARPDARSLAGELALPMIGAAALLKGVRLARRGLPAQLVPAFALGAICSFGSTLGALATVERLPRDRPLLPDAAYRLVLAGVTVRRLRENRS
ncbi:MAG TPA: undecaprenyl-diphosphate phosphatase [Solirubrobacteraceae bacterium]|nr:undecaprenyl-diphosphate phosphatase [Solirubrobacteraceae bacterium]